MEIILNIGKKEFCPSWNLPKLTGFFISLNPKMILKIQQSGKEPINYVFILLSVVYLTSCLIIIVILLVLKIFRRNLIVVMGLRMRVLKSLLQLNLCLFKWLKKKTSLAKLKIFKNQYLTQLKRVMFYPRCLWFMAFKQLDSWKEYKHQYSHHRTYLNLQQIIVDIQIEETNRMSEKVYRVKEFYFQC